MNPSCPVPRPTLRRFFLERSPDEGTPALTAADREHALRVLRVAPGDHFLGLDGRGRAWVLAVRSADRRRLELEVRGEPIQEPAAGAPGSPLPWIELHCPLPKAGRAEELLDRLTQLGLSRLVPLVTARTAPHARTPPPARLERLGRTAREALKQCGRLWLPEVGEPRGLAEGLGAKGTRLVLDPDAPLGLAQALAGRRERESWWTREDPLILIAGPEGGLDGEEVAALGESGATAVRLAPHVLRIETAAEAALAIAAHALCDG